MIPMQFSTVRRMAPETTYETHHWLSTTAQRASYGGILWVSRGIKQANLNSICSSCFRKGGCKESMLARHAPGTPSSFARAMCAV